MAGSPTARAPVRPSDLTAVARIRNAALEGFANEGIAATSIRDVAAAARVSPGLVQHHFGTKAGLRKAVNEYVIDVAIEELQDLFETGGTLEAWAETGDIVTTFVRDNALALRYLARATIEGDADAAEIFDTLVGIADRSFERLARDGALDPSMDRAWAAVHVVVFNIGSVLLEPLINRHLPEPFFTAEQLQRWNRATTELYRRAFSRQPHSGTKRSGSKSTANKRAVPKRPRK